VAGPRIKIDILGDASKFKRAVDDVERGAGQMEAKFAGLAGKIAAGFAVIGGAQFLKGAIDSAGDIGEQLSKLNVLVGDSADELDAWSKTTAKSFGIARGEALVAAGDFANFFKTAGLSNKAAADMSKEFVELAADMASFNNASPTETLEALGAALRGESEPIRKFGVLLDDATLRQQALDMGLVKTTKETLPPAIKLQAAYAAVLAQTTKQQGDFGRTSESAANQQRILAAEFKELQTEIGLRLLPAWQEMISLARESLPALSGVAGVLGATAGGMADLAGVVVDVGGAMSGALVPIGGFTLGMVATGKALEGIAGPAKSAYDAVTSLAGGLSAVQAGGLLGVAAGGLLTAWFIDTRIEAERTRQEQEALAQSLRDANDPTRALADRYAKLAEELGKVTGATGEADDAITKMSSSTLLTRLQADDTLDTFNRMGLSLEDVNAMASRASSKEFIAFQVALRGIAKQTGVSIAETDALVSSVNNVRVAYQSSRDEIGGYTKDMLQAAVSRGKLSQAELDGALATADGVTEIQRWFSLSQKYAGLIDELAGEIEHQGDASADAADAAGELAGATGDVADAAEDAAAAAEDQAEALEKLIEKQNELLGVAEKLFEATLAASNADLAYARQLRSLAETNSELALATATLDSAVTSYGAGSTEAATAQYEYQIALDAVKSESLETAASAVELARKQAESEGRTLDAAAAQAIMVGKLGELRDSAGDPALAAYLDALILKYAEAGARAAAAAAQVAELSRQMALSAGATTGQGMGIITSAAAAERLAGARAAGGPVSANKSYLVGEDGPEVLSMGSQSGRITPNDALGGGGGTTINLTINGVIDEAMVAKIHEMLRRFDGARR
jgi:hypothetical protein